MHACVQKVCIEVMCLGTPNDEKAQDHPEFTPSFLYMCDYSTWSLEAVMFLHGFGSARQGCVTNPNQGYVSRMDALPPDKVMSSIGSML